MTDVLTPAQVEQRDYDKGAGILAVRDSEFARAPAYVPGEGEWGALKEMARSMCITEFVPKEMRGRPFAVLGALLTGRDLGLPPMMALRRIYVVNGRPALEGAVKVALVRQRGHKITVVPGQWTAESCTVRGWRKGDPADEYEEVTYSIEDAKVAGDYDKPGDTYKKRPKQMLYWRAAGLLCDTYFPDVTLGIPDVEDAAALPAEVIEGRYVDADRGGALPEMPTDTPLTREEHAAAEEARLERAAAEMPASASPPPPPPRRRGRGPGPAPNPQQGADSGGPTDPSAAAPAGSPAPAATPAPAGAAADPQRTDPAVMARGLGLDDVAERLERGEHVPDSGDEVLAARAAETAATAAPGPGATPAAPEGEQASASPAAAAQDPFDGEGAAPAEDELARLRQQAKTYAVFLKRRQLEKKRQPAGNVEALEAEADAALQQVSRQMLQVDYVDLTADAFRKHLLPWLRQRYAAEGGKE